MHPNLKDLIITTQNYFCLLQTVNEVKKPLTDIFIKSLQEGKIPDPWKLANITPLHKKGPKTSTKNYRPISLTSVVSKLMEKIVRDKIMSHMEENGLFTKHQHGFSKGYSCVTQLIDVCENGQKNWIIKIVLT